jgi:predicted nucleic acid-binding protein
MESCCFIDVAKYTLERKDSISDLADREGHIQHCIKILEAAKNGELRLFTANLTISECQHLDGFIDDEVKRLFRSVLTSGRIVQIITDSIFIAEQARDLRWKHQICLSGADSHHVSTALEAGCEEFITFDSKILKNADKLKRLGLRVIKADETHLLPKGKPSRPESKIGQNTLFNDSSDSVS